MSFNTNQPPAHHEECRDQCPGLFWSSFAEGTLFLIVVLNKNIKLIVNYVAGPLIMLFLFYTVARQLTETTTLEGFLYQMLEAAHGKAAMEIILHVWTNGGKLGTGNSQMANRSKARFSPSDFSGHSKQSWQEPVLHLLRPTGWESTWAECYLLIRGIKLFLLHRRYFAAWPKCW